MTKLTIARDANTLEWLKRLDREDAARSVEFGMYSMNQAGRAKDAWTRNWHLDQASMNFERACKQLERLVELNLDGKSHIRL